MKSKEKIAHEQYFLNVRFITKDDLEDFCELIEKPHLIPKSKKKKRIRYSDLTEVKSSLEDFL